jgi:TPR repeat protein
MYQNGHGVAKNKKKLLFWLERAIRDNPRNALYVNGRMLPPVVTNGAHSYRYPAATAAIAWTRKMAAQGSPISQNDLGRMYENGTGVPRDSAQAVEWFEKAAAQSYAPAERNLGILFRVGVAVPKDYIKARMWLMRAARQRDGIAAYELGRLYYSGSGVPKDLGQSARWYQASAEDGFDAGQFTSAMWFAEGRGVPQDDEKSIKWFLIALASPDNEAINIEQLNMVEARISPERLSEAQSAAREWWRSYGSREIAYPRN